MAITKTVADEVGACRTSVVGGVVAVVAKCRNVVIVGAEVERVAEAGGEVVDITTDPSMMLVRSHLTTARSRATMSLLRTRISPLYKSSIRHLSNWSSSSSTNTTNTSSSFKKEAAMQEANKALGSFLISEPLRVY